MKQNENKKGLSKFIAESFKFQSIQKRIEIIVYTELLLGINRLYIIGEKSWTNLVRLYGLAVVIGCTYVTWNYNFSTSTSYLVLKYVDLLEFCFLVASASFFQQIKFENVLSNLVKIDASLDVQNNIYYLKAAAVGFTFTVCIIVYTIAELTGTILFLGDMWKPDLYVTYIVLAAHDFEHVLFCYSMRSILLRLYLIKGHVKKLMKEEELSIIYSRDEPSDVLARRVKIDISVLHKIYEDLHQNSQDLNTVMGLPILVMYFTAGITCVFYTRNIYEMLLMPSSRETNIGIIYNVLRCVRYSISVVFPCMVAYDSEQAVQEIRSILRNVSLTGDLNPIEQRKVQAFLHLTCDRPFHYSLCGMIRLTLSIPFSYLSLCTTYLVLLIQMNKFID